MRARLALLAALAAASSLVAGCSGPAPSSPVASIPKLVVDRADNLTTVTITSVNADVRYLNITVTLTNANLSAPIVFHEVKAYALVAHTNLSFFTINATADEAAKIYYYNGTWNIVDLPSSDPPTEPTYQIYIRLTANGPIQTERVPFRQILAEGSR
jgi:hypothetical protein